MLGTVHVDGGALIIRNATITRPSGGGSDMFVWNAGCVEFTDTMLVNGGQLWVGCGGTLAGADVSGCGASCCQRPDNSTVYVNGSTSEMAMPILGSNETVKVEDTIWGNGLGGGGTGTKVEIHDSLVMSIGLSFDSSLNAPIEISGLHPGHFSSWDLRRDLSLPMIPWDLSLSNVTVVPNTVGPGPFGRYLGWDIGVGQGTSHGAWSPCSWPKITVRNSVLASLGFGFQWNFQWCSYDDPVVFSGIPSIHPLNATYFNSIQLVNTTVNGQFSVTMRNLNMTFINVPALQLWPYYSGKSHLTFINSTLTDGGLIGCECLVSSVNSRFGAEHGGWEMINQVPYHDLLPLYDTDAASYGGGGIVDSRATITGGIDLTHLFFARSTVNRFYPVIVSDGNDIALAGVRISLSSQVGTSGRWWTTDREGKVEIPVLFNDGNWTDSLKLTASTASLSKTIDLSLKMATPVKIVLAPPIVIVASCADATVGNPVMCIAGASGGHAPLTPNWSAPGAITTTAHGLARFNATYGSERSYVVTVTYTDASNDHVSKNITVRIISQNVQTPSSSPTPSNPASSPSGSRPILSPIAAILILAGFFIFMLLALALVTRRKRTISLFTEMGRQI